MELAGATIQKCRRVELIENGEGEKGGKGEKEGLEIKKKNQCRERGFQLGAQL